MLHLPLKPSPNETMTLVLNPRGARRVALGSGARVRGLTSFIDMDWAQ
jgi:hypothetical protein